MDDGKSGAREIYYKYWMGNKFSERVMITPNNAYWSENNLAMFDKDNGFIAGHIVNRHIYFTWKVNGVWQPYMLLTEVGGLFSDCETADLSKDGKIAAVAFTGGYAAVFLTTSEPIIVNLPPVPVISTDQTEVFWKDTVNFDGSHSSDPDGSIVKYEWDFGDGEKAQGSQVAHAYVKKDGDLTVKLTVTDNKGVFASATKAIKVKVLYSSPATYEKKKIRTLFYDKFAYFVSWTLNPKNTQAGYEIVKYKVLRKAVGAAGDYAEIAEVNAATTSYRDWGIEQSSGKEYEYTICAVDAQGHVSPVNRF
jgi:hypothetical protein